MTGEDSEFAASMIDKSFKRTPIMRKKTVIDNHTTEIYGCPGCDHNLSEDVYDRLGTYAHSICFTIPRWPNFCPYCGQALKWEDDNDNQN